MLRHTTRREGCRVDQADGGERHRERFCMRLEISLSAISDKCTYSLYDNYATLQVVLDDEGRAFTSGV